ncbi:hypothetical protein DSCA_10730 [Desulfosarcina alkanivorans]|uniref:Uncharacterized protein n=2 Tax=Desulfosarcina alkanivorans TaxID=571177 RepID=A0A5K7YEZ2_9BACT|nr:hypothetical protein DSCA_10730 [Desulfosarcina alkanivorans]
MIKMRFRYSCVLVFAVLMLSWVGVPGSLMAKESCRISVETILAARQDTVVDPQLARYIGELQSMFNYTSYRLLGSERLTLQSGQSGMVSLPGNRRLKITPHKISGKRADIGLQMMKRKRTVFQTQIQLLNRGSLFVGGPKYKNGNLIFKISSSH